MKVHRVEAITEIPLLIDLVGGDDKLAKELTDEFRQSQNLGVAYFVRYGKGVIDRTYVEIRNLLTQDGRDEVMSDDFWDWADERGKSWH